MAARSEVPYRATGSTIDNSDREQSGSFETRAGYNYLPSGDSPLPNRAPTRMGQRRYRN
jgi:hypothetical protein